MKTNNLLSWPSLEWRKLPSGVPSQGHLDVVIPVPGRLGIVVTGLRADTSVPRGHAPMNAAQGWFPELSENPWRNT